MVASSSMAIAENESHAPLYYFWRQSIAAAIGVILFMLVLKFPLIFWQKISGYILLFGIGLLILVLVPGIGREVNGSTRWINLGYVALQASEPIRFCVILYLADYLVRHGENVRTTFAGFIYPILVLTLITVLLLLQPDYGSCVVLFSTALGMLFIGCVPLKRFLLMSCAIVLCFAVSVMMSPYRMQRLMIFRDPWQDPYGSGFQLIQALIAFGRGNWFGTGLGNGIQKLLYLPEAHTDFLFAILAEELGLIGTITIIIMFVFLFWRAFRIGNAAARLEKLFAAYLAYGIGLVIGLQAFINIGVNMGMLPTKGITLPLLSYGGNSLVISCFLLGLLLRVDWENRLSIGTKQRLKGEFYDG